MTYLMLFTTNMINIKIPVSILIYIELSNLKCKFEALLSLGLSATIKQSINMHDIVFYV